jgi:hypothetical protein
MAGMISEEDVQKALDRLRFGAKAAAKARAERLYLESFLKSAKSLIMKNHASLPIAAQEREALADPEYISYLEAYRTAVEADEMHRWQLSAAQAVIEAWRTESANYRGELKIG